MARQVLLPKWQEIDPNTLSAKAKAAYTEYKKLYSAAQEARKAFEAQLQSDAKAGKVVDADHELVISYNFGKLSVNVAKSETKSESKAGKGAAAFGGLSLTV